MRRLRIFALILAATVGVLAAVGVTQAAVNGHVVVKHAKTVKHPKTAKKVHGLAAPGLLTPANGAHVQQIPTLTWSAVNGAAEYEYQLAADSHFHAIVLGAGTGKGESRTYDLAAALAKSVTDGTYYWRVRALTATKQAGPWSATRTVVKAWSEAPQLLGPGEGAAITWPTVPLVLSWTPVKSATRYIVTIATDKELSNIVLGSATSPTMTWGTVFALAGELPTGQYYWAITPVDAQGHHGARSAVSTFNWSWPTQTATSITPLNSQPGEMTLKWTPEFTWNPVPGAARYEIEVSSAEGYPPGSTWFKGTTIGTTSSPLLALNNNEYFWRVRAIDASGNAGAWNEGPRFTKAFDDETPTIQNLHMVNIHGEATPEHPTTGTPIVTWSPVPGAASYEVEVGCSDEELAKVFFTGSPAWTPLASGPRVGEANWPAPQDGTDSGVKPGVTCSVRVAARSDVDAFDHQIESAQTLLPGGWFKYEPRVRRCTTALKDESTAEKEEEIAAEDKAKGDILGAEEEEQKAAELSKAAKTIYDTYEYLSKAECETETSPPTALSTYLAPQYGSTSTRAPLFTWTPVPGAECYYVAISRDPYFTNVADVAKTYGTAYAPPVGGEEPLDDETTTYYWTVFPVETENPKEPCKGALFGETGDYSEFNKNSVPPTPISPVGGVEISTQPTFKWTPAEGALNYTVQVAANTTFAEPIDEVKTDSTAYTSAKTYPANTTLYWRVRANDANTDGHEGLHWSAVQTFKRTLPVPVPSLSNPLSVEAIPAFYFAPVPGATGYEVHVEQPDGTTKNFTFDSTAFAPIEWDGPGVWRWNVRAEFPTASATTNVSGGYSAPQAVAHSEAPPSDVVGEKVGSRIVISWSPEAYAKEYEVQISNVNTFATTLESHRTEQASWAPNVNLAKKENKGTLYWRVAAIDNKNNVGPYATGSFVPPKPKCVEKKVKKGKKTVKECVVSKHKPAKTKKKRG